jgi:hypothetical protein
LVLDIKIIIIFFLIILFLIILFLISIFCLKFYESFDNTNLEYPCRVFLSDRDFLKHMIPHHQVAIDMCKMLLKNTKSNFLIYLSYRMIKKQESEVILLNDLLKSSSIE